MAEIQTPPPAPQTPAGPQKIDRRTFLSWTGVAWVSFAAATTGALSIVLRYLFPNVVFEPPTSFKAGFPDDYEIGVVDERWKEKFGVWLIRTAEGMFALSTICTHLGCTPNWLSTESKFKCPCHGSGFYKSGINFEGPAPRPLERYRIMRAEDGQILIDKSKKFQQEKGEWNNPEAFLTL
ncbi:MAG: ubiquinol-cytochrome c reductase iron-sulfur subunit [Candidatus Omnitrophica bacterium]|nr:ubiquinol-cytochrome c reductase iron-sulfur subunit [Candidatus Omnitrophota bacterium]